MSKNNGPSGLTLFEFSDRELLLALSDAAVGSHREEGWVTAGEFARAIGLTTENASRQVGARFAWMRRYGVVELTTLKERDDEQEEMRSLGGWRLTAAGLKFAHGELTGPERRALEKLKEDQALAVGMSIGELHARLGSSGRVMLRRAMRYQMGTRAI